MKFVINPGHGGSDPGARGNGLLEKDLNLAVALALGPLLIARGVKVLYTRRLDVTMTLQSRSDIIVINKADAAIDIHHNAFNGSARGTETYCSAFNNKSRSLAEAVHPGLIRAFDMPNRGIKTRLHPKHKNRDYYHMIREPHKQAGIPVIITETGFIDNTHDAAIMKRADFVSRQAEALAKGICAYFGVAWEQSSTLQPAPVPTGPMPSVTRRIGITVNGRMTDIPGYLINNVTYAPVSSIVEIAKGQVSAHGDHIRIVV